MPELTPFEELQQFIGPNGPGSKKHIEDCSVLTHNLPERACDCNYSSVDTEAPLLKALWKECWCHPSLSGPGLHPNKSECRGTGYLPRSRAKAALLLPESCPQLTLRHAKLPSGQVHYGTTLNEWWVASFPCPIASHDHSQDLRFFERTCLRTEADNWLDALCAAELAALKAKKVANA